MPTLSNAALALLRACYSGAYILVDDDNRVAYRELADVGLMTPLHTPLGRESAYRMTEAGVSASASLFPSQPEAPSPHRSPSASSRRRLSELLHGFLIRLRPARAR
jgi:hypothetical protein